MKVEMERLQNDLALHQVLLEDMEMIVGNQTKKFVIIIQDARDEVARTKADLEAAKEEIAVKVAQVKQYQKQVEAYKQQVSFLKEK